MAALKIFLSDDPKISKDVMSKFFLNLLVQTQSISDDSVLIKFGSISLLAKSVNEIFQKHFFNLKKKI